MADIERIHKLFTCLVDERQPAEATWAEVARFYLPTSMNWNTAVGSYSKVRGTRVYDDTPAWAAGRFASAMLGMVTNPSQKWLEFELYSEEEELSWESQLFLTKLRDKALFKLQVPEAGFYDKYHEHILDYGIFGEAIMFMEKDAQTKLTNFIPYPLEECYTGLGPLRTIDKVFRKWKMSAQMIVEVFSKQGDTIPDEVLRAVTEKKYDQEFEVVHGVFPRKHGVAGGFANNKPWASIYYMEKDKKQLRESGFDIWPFSTPRFTLFASEKHGQGPGTLSLATVKALNSIVKTTLTSDQRRAAPAYIAARRGWVNKPNLSPDHINYYDGFDIKEAMLPLANEGRPEAGKEWVEMYRQQIARAFFLDRLITPEKKAEIKELEVLMGEEERMRDLIPQLSRLHAESISHIIRNVVHHCIDEFDDIPEELNGKSLKLRYLSPLARAQRMLEVSSANRTLQQVVLPISQIEPSATKAIDWYKFVGWSLEQSGFPKEVRRPEEEYRAEEEATNQQQQLGMGLEAGLGVSEMAKNFAQAQSSSQGNPMQGFL